MTKKENSTTDNIERITENVEYDIMDTKRHTIIGTFRTPDLADRFLEEEPIFRKPEIKIIPTITYRDFMSLTHLIGCMATIFDTDKKNWSDNEILNNIIKEFLEKIDDIHSDKSVKGYVQ